MKKKLLKISISIFSLIIFLGLVEVSLRVAGHFHSLSRRTRGGISARGTAGLEDEEEKGYVILSLGDSFTYGGNVSFEQTYPYILQTILARENLSREFTVVNAGVCEHNSRQVLARLPDFINKYKPNMVLLLVGATDRFNFAGYNFEEKGIKSLFYDLRIYKMFKIISLNLRARRLGRMTRVRIPYISADSIYKETRDDYIQDYFREMEQKSYFSKDKLSLEKAWYYFYKGERKKAVKIGEKMLQAEPDSPRILCDLAHFYYYVPEEKRHPAPHQYLDEDKIKKAARLYQKAESISPDSDFVLSHLAHFYRVLGEDYLAQHKHDLAVNYLLESIKLDPFFYFPYYLITWGQKMQSKYDADYIVEVFQEMVQDNPALKESSIFRKYLAFFRDQKKWEKKIEKKMKENLKGIVEICGKNNIDLVIQNYPYPYATANRILKQIALENSLLFVDHRSLFDELVKGENWETYFHFYTDEHCSPEGYQAMAENIYNLVFKDKF